jgi:hypothetical protein
MVSFWVDIQAPEDGGVKVKTISLLGQGIKFERTTSSIESPAGLSTAGAPKERVSCFNQALQKRHPTPTGPPLYFEHH